MVRFIDGDLIELAKQGEFDYIIHGCNCFNTMGAGIALQIATTFPQAFVADTYRSGDVDNEVELLGDYSVATVKYDKKLFTIINLYTQYKPGKNFNLSALKIGLFKLATLIPKQAKIGMPYIGAGIGGGDWTKIVEAIRVHFADHDCTVVKYVLDKVRDGSIRGKEN